MPTLTKKPQVEKNSVEIPSDIQKQLLSLEMLPTSALVVDESYQRDYDSARVVKMANEWNWLGCRSLAVSLRNNGDSNEYAVIDGQQRLGAIRLNGYKEAPCSVYVDLTKEQEAELYELLNKNKKLYFNDLFKSRLMRGEEVAHHIDIAVQSVGYHLDPERRHHGPKSKDSHFYIQTMAELERIYKEGGINLIRDTLKFVKDAWAPEYIQQEQMVLAGVSTFLRRYPKANMTQMKLKLQKIGLVKSIQMSLQFQAVHGKGNTGGNSRGNAFCEGMLIAYNSNREEKNRIKSKAW